MRKRRLRYKRVLPASAILIGEKKEDHSLVYVILEGGVLLQLYGPNLWIQNTKRQKRLSIINEDVLRKKMWDVAGTLHVGTSMELNCSEPSLFVINLNL